MTNFWHINGNFLTARSNRIGASDIPALIPDPENLTQSLSGYDRTAITVYLEKTGKKERDKAGLPAEMGHYLENKALEIFIREITNKEKAKDFIKKKYAYEELTESGEVADPQEYQETHFKHNCQYYDTGKIAHPDCVFTGGLTGSIFRFGLKIDLTKPFIIEAKSATYWSAKRPTDSLTKGYDLELKTWQGIPLKHYVQIQFQLRLFDIDTAYLALLYNTSDFHVWEIKANKKHQDEIMDIADYVAFCIANDTPPTKLAINQDDIKMVFPCMKKDFILLSGEEKEKAFSLAKLYQESKEQEKKWKNKKEECLDSMSILLRDNAELRDNDGSCIAAWQERKGYEKIISLSELQKNENFEKLYKYFKRNKCLINTASSKSVVIKYKED